MSVLARCVELKKQTYEQRSVCVPFIFTVVYHQLPVLIHLAFRNSTGIEISKSPSSHGNTSTKQLARAVVIAELSFARCLFLCRRELYYFVLGWSWVQSYSHTIPLFPSFILPIGLWPQFYGNIQIKRTNTQCYCTVQKQILNRFEETVATPWHNNFWINYCSFSSNEPDCRLFFFNQSNYSTTLVTHHISCRASCQLSFCLDMFTNFSIKTVGNK